VVRMVEEGLGSTDRPLQIRITGSWGELSGDVAMPLAVVLTELVQNAVDHSASDGSVDVTLRVAGKELEMRVVDGGAGVPEGFALDRDAGLGLTIVRTFVVHDLGGSISIGRADPSPPFGTAVEIRVPRPGPNLPVG